MFQASGFSPCLELKACLPLLTGALQSQGGHNWRTTALNQPNHMHITQKQAPLNSKDVLPNIHA